MQDDVIEAAKLSNAHGFITALPQGYDTKVRPQLSVSKPPTLAMLDRSLLIPLKPDK